MTALQLTSQELAATRPQQFDSIVYVNVLEHILDDAAEMRTAFDLSPRAARSASSCRRCHGSTAASTTSRATTAGTTRRACAR